MQQRKNSNKVLPEEALQPFPRFFSETKAKLVYEKCKNKAKDIFVKSKRKDENIDDLNI